MWRTIVAAFGCMLLTACTKSDGTPVTITQAPLNLQTVKAAAAKAACQSKRGLTQWFFHCEPQLDYRIAKPFADSRLTLEITGIKMKIGLSVRQSLGANADARLIDHERGHLMICQQLYSDAADIAKIVCTQSLGETYQGFGADEAGAITSATETACQAICNKYKDNTVARVNQISDVYDQLTEHGRRNVDYKLAVSRSFEASD